MRSFKGGAGRVVAKVTVLRALEGGGGGVITLRDGGGVHPLEKLVPRLDGQQLPRRDSRRVSVSQREQREGRLC